MWIICGHGNQLSGQYDHWPRNKEGVISDWDSPSSRTVAVPLDAQRVKPHPADLVRELPQRQCAWRDLSANEATLLEDWALVATGSSFPISGSR